MNTHYKLMMKVVGKRGGISWKCTNTWTNGMVNVQHPGTYRKVTITNGWPSSGDEFEIAEAELRRGNQFYNWGVLV